jgi:RNA polymerase sigma-70 factor (ECF subfamily)
MSSEEASFVVLMSQVRGGSQDAAWELIARYGDLVRRVVRKQLPRELRKAFDSDDFVQVAWGTIFRHRSRLCRFETSAEFVAFLAAVAANKVRGEVRRRLHQQKHNVNREHPLDQAEDHVVESVPTPSQVAIAREKWFRILENQPAHYQEVVKLRYVGHSSREIADRIGLDEGTVRRILRRIFKGAAQ